ncbi:hypothetical protein BMR03_15855, partial [Methylococcaceae bacterium HT2]
AIAWLSDTKGLIFNTNNHRVGFSLGTAKSQVIRLHRDFEGVFIFKYTLGGEINVFYKSIVNRFPRYKYNKIYVFCEFLYLGVT